MRVTENSNYNMVRNSVGKSKGRMENLQMQTSTMRKLNQPSDDPVGAAKVMEMRTDKVNMGQFLTNAKMAENMLNMSELALSDMTDLVMRAKEIAIGQASSASSNDESRLGVAEEVGQLYEQAISAANRRVGDRYIFGGYKSDKPAVDPDGKYKGDEGQIMVEIGRDVFLATNISGLEAFNTIPESSSDRRDVYERENGRSLASDETTTGQNVNLFDQFQDLRIQLLTGDIDGVRDSLDKFDALQGRLVALRSKLGSRLQGVQNMSQSLDRQSVTNAQLSSMIEDADMVQVMSDLAKEETVLRSTMASSQKLVQPRLMDFLK